MLTTILVGGFMIGFAWSIVEPVIEFVEVTNNDPESVIWEDK